MSLDSIPPTRRPPFEFSGRQKALFDVLNKKAPQLANMYWGGLIVLQDSSNPEHLHLAAHSFRELMEKMPRDLQLPQPDNVREGDKVAKLKVAWLKVTKKWPNKNSTERWVGHIDIHLKNWLAACEEFFNWHDTDRPTKQKSLAKMIRSLDPAGVGELPPPIEIMRVEEWKACHDFFTAVSHHRKVPALAEFSKWVSTLEIFLLDRMVPRTFSDHESLDRLIQEGEQNAVS